ncbi:tRNA A64-2'-O-ribosylphosphate transferase [Fimicolochytrium jonesii]|uniref:tRNA A64-2'-O-ribosylphosphate transferase n=1 Tax=Fimicolochytrium jonesii TaxID=1396493 RepID=UPI0022FE590D|nr:tRNA A64-2'-O-ribosylphosphate transferase [Fimicolochytrium jonesii]KAI8822457.1 tRNA A64-2'-O-ribosylphosphate transferase [Fimicolochytrium jonesii]
MSCKEREAIRRESRNIHNRLRSIGKDSEFVTKVADHFRTLPLIANERCGSWYVDPKKAYPHSVYFKSTDGHFGNWDFNLRRLNYHIIKTIAQRGGCIIVDSTRNGKRIPDSLAKTVPIWCAVINGAVARHRQKAAPHDAIANGTDDEKENLAGDQSGLLWDTAFHSIPSIVSRSESQQISQKLPPFVDKLLASSVNVPELSLHLHKPLRPLWITPTTNLALGFDWAGSPDALHDLPFYPVILLSASQAVPDGMDRRVGYTYVQGSADDHELWGRGLEPEMFWAHREELLDATDDATCEQLVQRIVRDSHLLSTPLSTGKAPPSNLLGDTNISIGNHASGRPPDCFRFFDVVINCGSPEHPPELLDKAAEEGKYLFLPIPEGKKGQHALFSCLPMVLAFVKGPLRERKRVLVHCMQGKDRSVGIALAMLVRYMDDEGHINVDADETSEVTKDLIQNRLLFIQSHRIVASPTRATLQKVKTYFMSAEYK